MKKVMLGKTGLEVSELCFGALPMGPLQKKLPVEDGAAIIVRALNGGINFIDTAQLYQTYEPIKLALEQTTVRPVIASKSTSSTYEAMRQAVDEAREAMGLEMVDVFHLHAARADEMVFEQRRGAWKCLQDCKSEGLIRAVGVSTHSVPVVKKAAAMEDVDVVFPIINIKGTGILQGTLAEMEAAIHFCQERGKGVYLMKVLGGGCLVEDYHQAVSYARRVVQRRAPLAMGMVSQDEVDFNLAYFQAGKPEKASLPPLQVEKKWFQVVEVLCKQCGTCVDFCPNGAISRESADQTPVVNHDLCLRCGYCVGECPQFAIRMV